MNLDLFDKNLIRLIEKPAFYFFKNKINNKYKNLYQFMLQQKNNLFFDNNCKNFNLPYIVKGDLYKRWLFFRKNRS